ncbi:MAG: regulatory protein RecX [Chloroflexota bacterium]
MPSRRAGSPGGPPDPRAPRQPPAPGRITAIRAQVNDPDRASVLIDGEFAFGLPALAVAEERLAPGQDLDAGRIAALLAIDERARAASAALAFLAYRPRSGKEVRDRLRQKGFAPPAIDHAIARLESWRYLDDEEFARRWVENRTTHHPRGGRLIEQELRVKGVDRDIARGAVDGAAIDERAAAIEAAVDRARRLSGEEPAAARRKLAAWLARRGFGWDAVRPALDAALGPDEDPADP